MNNKQLTIIGLVLIGVLGIYVINIDIHVLGKAMENEQIDPEYASFSATRVFYELASLIFIGTTIIYLTVLKEDLHEDLFNEIGN